MKDAVKYVRKLKDLWKENIELRNTITKQTLHINELEITVNNQEQQIANLEKAQLNRNASCPSCNMPFQMPVPYSRISGVHYKDGDPMMSTRRGTLEREVACPNCRTLLHIDFI